MINFLAGFGKAILCACMIKQLARSLLVPLADFFISVFKKGTNLLQIVKRDLCQHVAKR
jgi:hypothetical protein